MTTPIKQFVAAKAFIAHDGKILVIRESAVHPTNTQVGKYDVIGGRIEPGETVLDALRREVQEECGLDISIGRAFFVNESRNTIRNEQCQIIRIFFVCTVDGQPQITLNEEHDQAKWIAAKNYRQENIIENLFPAFEAFLELK